MKLNTLTKKKKKKKKNGFFLSKDLSLSLFLSNFAVLLFCGNARKRKTIHKSKNKKRVKKKKNRVSPFLFVFTLTSDKWPLNNRSGYILSVLHRRAVRSLREFIHGNTKSGGGVSFLFSPLFLSSRPPRTLCQVLFYCFLEKIDSISFGKRF